MKIKGKILRLGENGRLWIVLGALAMGLLLIILGGQGGETRKSSSETDLRQYASELEEEIRELCSRVSGVSRVTVAVSLAGGTEYVYATDSRGDPVTVGGGSSATGLVVKQKLPQIAGVGIVCRGGGDPGVQSRLIKLICAAYGVGANRIFITEGGY